MTDRTDSMSPPVSSAEFAAAMAAFAPFESRPALAVAVSGGRDSLALTLLADEWVAARKGRLVALTVDHGLRTEAAGEARRVGGWLSARGIEHHVLVWEGPHPRTGVQAAARDARYRLLEGWCGAHGILHLLLGHQSGDQAETHRMRRLRQSAGVGLAGMSAIRDTPMLRILRPLLSIPRERLGATLAARDQVWIDDPSNVEEAYERSRVRAAPGDEHGVERALGDAMKARIETDEALARAAATSVAVLPEGFVRITAAGFAALPGNLGEMLLARCVMTVGGGIYPPRGARLIRLATDIAAGRLGRGRTLGGCRIMPEAATQGRLLLVVREAASLTGELSIVPGMGARWDGRFEIRAGDTVPAGLRVGALGQDGWRQIGESVPEDVRARVPVPVRPMLPAIRRNADIVAVPHLGVGRQDGIVVRFSPPRALTEAGFAAGPGGNTAYVT